MRPPRIGLRFEEPALEREFRDAYASRSKGQIRAAAVLSMAGAVPALILAERYLAAEPAFLAAVRTFLLAVQIPCVALVLTATWLGSYPRRIEPIQVGVHVVWGSALLALLAGAPIASAPAYALVGLVLIVFAGYAAVRLRFAGAAVAGWGVSAVYLGRLLAGGRVPPLDLSIHAFVVVLTNVWGMFIAHRLEAYGRRDLLRSRELAAAHERSEGLLRNILPVPVAERLKASPGAIADAVDEATVLFADLVGFTSLAEDRSPGEVVEILGEIFSTFDDLAERQGLEKIKTIGDAYMVAGGLPDPRADHVEAVAGMALAMRDAVEAIARRRGLDLRLRIGIHCGPLVAGVIGKRKFGYDVWGDTVNVASRMESHGEPGRIHVSDAVRDRLAGRFEFESRGRVAVKGKGEMTTWFLTGPRPTA